MTKLNIKASCEESGQSYFTIGIYIRVSTEEQAKEGYSIPAQKERLIAYCKAQGWTNYKFYVDEGVSAKDTNRPKLQLLMEHVKGGQINMILVYRLDRFTRKVRDLYNLLDVLDKHNCAFKSATEIYDTSSAMGRLFITLVAALAQWETENLSERVKMALEEKVSGGERVGNIPYGFDLNEDEKLVVNPKQSAVVLDIIEKIESGMSASSIAKKLTKINDDKETWHPTAIYRILNNPALYGATRWNDRIYENTHRGIITKGRFDKIQRMLSDRGIHRLREVESNYLFQGVLICPHCDNPLSVNRYVRTRKNGSQYQAAVYKCQVCYKEGRRMLSIGEYRFTDALNEYMKNFKFEDVKVENVDEKDNRAIYLDQMQVIEKKREKYQRAWAADLMTDEEFEKRMLETKDAYQDLQKKLNEFEAPTKIDVEAIKKIVFTFNESFAYLTQEEKRNFIQKFIRKIEFRLIPQPPQRPDKAKKGKDLVELTHVEFY